MDYLIRLVEQHLAIYGRGPQPEFTQNMLYTTGLEILSSFRICIWFLRVIGTKRATLLNVKQGLEFFRVSENWHKFHSRAWFNHMNPFRIIKTVIFHEYRHGPTHTSKKLGNRYPEMSILAYCRIAKYNQNQVFRGRPTKSVLYVSV